MAQTQTHRGSLTLYCLRYGHLKQLLYPLTFRGVKSIEKNFSPLYQPHLLSILGIFLLGTLESLADLAHGRHVDPLALE